ncbi:hypothetical protein EDB83DRAFT_2325570 [Lactarius deliciosus]|nr:hypothetical protein EDB83DRAFT_2325570 [Lactarius deliciosus]
MSLPKPIQHSLSELLLPHCVSLGYKAFGESRSLPRAQQECSKVQFYELQKDQDQTGLQPDLQLQSFLFWSGTGCGPVGTGPNWSSQPQPSNNASIDNDNQMRRTTTIPTPRPTAAMPTSIPPQIPWTGLKNSSLKRDLKTTTHHRQQPTTTTINTKINTASTTPTATAPTTCRQPHHKDDTLTTVTPRQQQHQQIDNDVDWPQQQHLDNHNDDTSTAATMTPRQPQH